mmetsp:Transcript_33480/g.38441  ORF Transcript_33480/g.38441 Transcript_33480/m.38441 type:complete len:90 (+) Transcript_33480:228-497(+)
MEPHETWLYRRYEQVSGQKLKSDPATCFVSLNLDQKQQLQFMVDVTHLQLPDLDELRVKQVVEREDQVNEFITTSFPDRLNTFKLDETK